MEWRAAREVPPLLRAGLHGPRIYKSQRADRQPNTADAQLPDHCYTLIFTSDTTGLPKAVMISHNNFTRRSYRILGTLYGISDAESRVSFMSLSHEAAQLLDVHLPTLWSVRVHGPALYQPTRLVCELIIPQQQGIHERGAGRRLAQLGRRRRLHQVRLHYYQRPQKGLIIMVSRQNVPTVLIEEALKSELPALSSDIVQTQVPDLHRHAARQEELIVRRAVNNHLPGSLHVASSSSATMLNNNTA